MRKSTGLLKRLVALSLVLLLSIESFAAVVGDNDGAAFITKAEFDSLKSTFQEQINRYNQSIDNKIDGAIAGYLDGITLTREKDINNNYWNIDKGKIQWNGLQYPNVGEYGLINTTVMVFAYPCNYADRWVAARNAWSVDWGDSTSVTGYVISSLPGYTDKFYCHSSCSDYVSTNYVLAGPLLAGSQWTGGSTTFGPRWSGAGGSTPTYTYFAPSTQAINESGVNYASCAFSGWNTVFVKYDKTLNYQIVDNDTNEYLYWQAGKRVIGDFAAIKSENRGIAYIYSGQIDFEKGQLEYMSSNSSGGHLLYWSDSLPGYKIRTDSMSRDQLYSYVAFMLGKELMIYEGLPFVEFEEENGMLSFEISAESDCKLMIKKSPFLNVDLDDETSFDVVTLTIGDNMSTKCPTLVAGTNYKIKFMAESGKTYYIKLAPVGDSTKIISMSDKIHYVQSQS